MLICPKCQIKYEGGKKFCRSCGSPLVVKEEPSSSLQDRAQIKEQSPKTIRICPRCRVFYESGKYCKKCGSVLVEQAPLQEKAISIPQPELKIEPSQIQIPEKRSIELPKGRLICPNCKILYDAGRFCKKCGSTLTGVSPQEVSKGYSMATPLSRKIIPSEPQPEAKRELSDAELIEKKSVKRLSKDWLTLSEEKKKLEDLIKKLEAKRSSISSDMFNTTFGRYEAQLKSISSRYQKIQTDLESVKTKTSEEIDLTLNALKPYKKRLEEAQSLYKGAALTKTDFVRERTELKREIRLRDNTLKKHQKVIFSLPNRMGGKVGSPRKLINFLQPTPVVASGIIILIAVAGYFLWPKYSYLIKKQPRPGGLISKEGSVSSTTSPSQPQPTTAPENAVGQEAEKMRSLFENIRQANIQKNIDLYMSCYSLDFQGREEKRKSTLENWQNFDYFDLSYDLKSQAISGDTASAKVEWVIKFSPKSGGQAQETKSFLDVTLKKEEGTWKIKEIKPVS